MTKKYRLLIPILTLAIILGLGSLFNYINEEKQRTEQQAMASLNHGIALFREKKYEESLEILKGIPEGVLKDWHLPYHMATAYVMLKDYESAAPILEDALELNPQEIEILFELGVVYFKLGNLALSKAYFGAVVDIDPSHEEAKGLMDIMANLEKQQVDTSQAESEPEPETEEAPRQQ